MMNYKVSLEEMLNARDRRLKAQQKILEEAAPTDALISFTLNIPGDIKKNNMTHMLFYRGLEEIRRLGYTEKSRIYYNDKTGDELLILVAEDPIKVKKDMETIEDSFPAARLFDLDVMNAQGEKLSRKIPRRCLLCDNEAHACARSRAHGLDAIKAKVNDLLKDLCADKLGEMGRKALYSELHATPKPGLVDEANNGAHKDMDLPLMEKSIEAIAPFLRETARLGLDAGEKLPRRADLKDAQSLKDEVDKTAVAEMDLLRARGIFAENAMFDATGGVNTHKGIIYSMGLLIYAMGKCITGYLPPRVFVVALAESDANERRKIAESNPSHGSQAYSKYGAGGAIGEALSGFLWAEMCASDINSFEYYGEETEEAKAMAGPLALLNTMRRLEDTNLLYRGGLEGLRYVKYQATRIMQPFKETEDFLLSDFLPEDGDLPPNVTPTISDMREVIEEIRDLDTKLIKLNLSPGGSADTLALGYLIKEWRKLGVSEHQYSSL